MIKKLNIYFYNEEKNNKYIVVFLDQMVTIFVSFRHHTSSPRFFLMGLVK